MPDTTPQSAGEKPKDEPRYDRDYLVSHSRALLGESSAPIVAGALALETRRKTFTVGEAKSLVSDYRKRRVPQEG